MMIFIVKQRRMWYCYSNDVNIYKELNHIPRWCIKQLKHGCI